VTGVTGYGALDASINRADTAWEHVSLHGIGFDGGEIWESHREIILSY